MKILHIITSLEVGGAQASLYNLIRYERQLTSPLTPSACEARVSRGSKYQRSIIYFHDGPFVQKLQSLGVETHHLKGFLSPYDFVAWFRLARLIKKTKPDLIHTALWSANIMGRLLGVVCRIPVLCDLHGDPADHGFFRNAIERVTLRLPTRFIAVSNSVQRSFLSLFSKKRYLPAKTCTIQNGIDASRLCFDIKKNRLSRKNLGVFESDFVVGSVGRLCSIKNYDLLIRAFAIFVRRANEEVPFVSSVFRSSAKKNVSRDSNVYSPKLCLVGDGPERSSLESLVQKLGLEESVLFVGEQSNPYRYYPLFDCFALSSESEGLSIALLEALSFGLPIITTHRNKKHDVIENSINGFVVPVDDVAALAHALEDLYKNSAMQVSMRKNNCEIVQNRFSIETMFQKYDQLYKEVI